ncbi:MAG: hypothetical protein WAK33_24855 [Silvibacterium sp.]
MPWWKRTRPATQAVAADPALRSFRLSLSGWSEQPLSDCKEEGRLWVDAEENAISVGILSAHQITSRAATPGWSLHHWARFFARDSSGGLIEADHVDLPFGPGLRVIYKTLEEMAYMYYGMLIFPRNDVDIIITVVSKELGTTGVREAVVTKEVFDQGRLDAREYERSFARDPYDPGYDGVDRSILRFISDDPIYDSRFPDHPLTKVRRLLVELPACISFDA